MDRPQTGDKFEESISHFVRIPFHYQIIALPLSEAELNANIYANNVLLNVLLAKHDKHNHHDERDNESDERINLLEAKLDLTLYLLGKLAASGVGIPTTKDIELSATGIRFSISSDEQLRLENCLRLELYLDNQFPQAVILHANVYDIAVHGDGRLVTGSFIDSDVHLREHIERYVFREHRRSIARIKNVNNS